MVEDNAGEMLGDLFKKHVDEELRRIHKEILDRYGHLFGEKVLYRGKSYMITGLNTHTIYDFPKFNWEFPESETVLEIETTNEIKVSFELRNSFVDIINLDAKDIIEYFEGKASGTNENK